MIFCELKPRTEKTSLGAPQASEGLEQMSAPIVSVNYGDVLRAANALAGVALRTPVLTPREADLQSGASVFFKCENFQRVGAFKFRGAYNAISSLSEPQKRNGVVAFSSGNHAQGIALASQLLGVSATIIMPRDAPAAKLAATRGYGAGVVLYEPGCDDREAIAYELAKEGGARHRIIPRSLQVKALQPRSSSMRLDRSITSSLPSAEVGCSPVPRSRRRIFHPVAPLSESNRRQAMMRSNHCVRETLSAYRCPARSRTELGTNILQSW
jgi:Pyridoxal-phosphate dependent enzyme